MGKLPVEWGRKSAKKEDLTMKKKVLAAAMALSVSLTMGMAAMGAELDTENPVKIGYVGALSGDTALWGQAGLNGMELTAKTINEEGGILGREVKIIGLDGKGMPDDSVAAYKKLVEEENERLERACPG